MTPSGSGKVNEHKQPDDARRVLDMLARAIPTAVEICGYGYDVIGAVSIDCRNDGSPVRVVEDKILAPQRDEHIHYERMVRNLCTEYRRRFGT